MVAGPNTGALKNHIGDNPMMPYQVYFDSPGRRLVWVRGMGDTNSVGEGKNDSVHIGLNDKLSNSTDKIDQFPPLWSWSAHTRDSSTAFIDIPSQGVHTLNVWMREDGFKLDKLVIIKA
jgi:hypothetical protein